MNKKDYWAKDNGESIEEHTNRLIKLFEAFLELYGEHFSEKEKSMIRKAICYHDLGKMNSHFQRYLYKRAGKEPPKYFNSQPYKELKGEDIPHGILSGAFINTKALEEKGYTEDDIKALVTAVCNHHSRSLECKENSKTIINIINQDLKEQAQRYGLDCCNSKPIFQYNCLKNEYIPFPDALWIQFALIKGILNKMDYAASAYYDTAEYPPIDAKIKVIKRFEKERFVLKGCQSYLLDKQDKNIIMTASTGMGKTEAALIWAGKDKTFYTLPYKVSINAIYQRIRNQNYYDSDKAVLLHSEALKELLGYETDPENDIYEIKKKYEKIRNFSYPFTVCTVDQLFLFSLRPLGSELMAATLSYSKVIIDEIQAYDPKLLAKILFGLDIVNRLKGKFMIMTATLPPFIKDFFVKKNIDCHITPTFFTDMIRHIFCVEKDFNYEFIKQKAKDNKILIICNTVSKSQQVFKDLKQYGLTLNLLHSRFILRDRKQKEEEILKFAPSINYVANNGVWITTQLVEASLDIDFDMLFTEMSTADSLLQRMGRCHRNRDYTHHVSNVYIYDTRNGVGSVYDEDIYQRSLDFLGAYADKPFLEEDKQKYINQVYDINGIKETKYYKNFDKEREKLEDLKNGFLDKKLAQKAFREIESVAVIPFKFADEARVLEQEISDLVKKDERDFLKISKLKENLRDLTLSINPYSTKRYKLSREKILDYPICLNQYCGDIGLIDYDQTDNAL